MEQETLPALPVIGDEIPWRAIKQQALRVVRYAPLAIVGTDTDLLGRLKVQDFSHKMPYALLEVELADETHESIAGWTQPTAIYPVFHREDFRGVNDAMTMLSDDMEVLVYHAPIKFPWYMSWAKKTMPSMAVWLCRAGAWERFRDEKLPPSERLKAFATTYKYEPLVDRFQGRWDYE